MHLIKLGDKNITRFDIALRNFEPKYKLYDDLKQRCKDIMSTKNKEDDFERSYSDINRWMNELDQIIKSKEVIAENIDIEEQTLKNMKDYIIRAQLAHIKEIEERYLIYD